MNNKVIIIIAILWVIGILAYLYFKKPVEKKSVSGAKADAKVDAKVDAMQVVSVLQ